MIDIIIDLETLGTRPGCVILEIGACAIDPRSGEITANFSRRLDEVFTRQDEALTMDANNTINWWHGPETVKTYYTLVRRGLPGMFPRTPRDPHCPLCEFAAWFSEVTSKHDPKEVRIWANGPSFDIAILQSAYDRYEVQRPWICWQERCVRTALEMANYERGIIGWIERGPRHRALNDARHEARKLYFSGALGEVSSIMLRLRQRYDIKARAVPS